MIEKVRDHALRCALRARQWPRDEEKVENRRLLEKPPSRQSTTRTAGAGLFGHAALQRYIQDGFIAASDAPSIAVYRTIQGRAGGNASAELRRCRPRPAQYPVRLIGMNAVRLPRTCSAVIMGFAYSRPRRALDNCVGRVAFGAEGQHRRRAHRGGLASRTSSATQGDGRQGGCFRFSTVASRQRPAPGSGGQRLQDTAGRAIGELSRGQGKRPCLGRWRAGGDHPAGRRNHRGRRQFTERAPTGIFGGSAWRRSALMPVSTRPNPASAGIRAIKRR